MANKTKRCLAALISAAMVFCMGITVPYAEEPPADALLVDITFDEAGTGSGSFEASKGGIITEHGSVGYTASYNGDGNKALYISTDAAGNYLELPKGILNGREAATFAFWIRPESRWAFMTTPVDSQVFLNEKYMGMLASPSALTVERYNNSGARLSSVTANDTYTDWVYVVVTFEANGTKVYVNGTLAASDNAEVDIKSLMSADASTWIGHANWGSGEGFSGKMDNFRIYGKALNEDEIAALSAEAVERETAKLVKEKNCLEIDTQFYNPDGEKVFQAKPGETVTVKTTVTNYRPSERKLFYHIENASQGSAAASVYTEEITLPIMGSKEFTATLTGGVDYLICLDDITSDNQHFEAGYLPCSEVSFPKASPADSASTTEGAHDPTIFKDPVSRKYYAYSSHNLVFESDDLINWKKNDYTGTITVPAAAKEFISANYSGTEANTTYWAPDILYKEGDEYPYWFYLSTSCGLGGRNSVISLIKAKSPGLWDGEYTDAGVVVVSKENNNYNTNAIDANIFTDSDGKTYFIWGSFWKGIHMVELDDQTGLAKGVDYTSDATVLSSCEKFGTRMYSTPSGVAGPEGPYTVYNKDNGYRYMFTSYGWLGTNYNIRVARTNKTFAEILSGKDPHKQLLDQKNRPVGATYTDQVKEGGTLGELWGYKMSGSFKLGDGIEYLGSGHNSVFQDDDGEWYLVQHCRKIADAVAYLQVKKILWTEDGWPVISPMVYSGEKLSAIPEAMIYGTWDLSSVGHTILADGVTDVSSSGAYKGSDLPVHSSQIILERGGRLGNDMGTWSFDGNYTVTLNFTQNGAESDNRYFKAGDTMKLFVMTGYDKDKRESALVLTGTDQNSVAHFASKNNAAASSTIIIPKVDTTPVVIDKSAGGNPVLGFDDNGGITYGGDPSVLVDGDTVYIFVGHDVSVNDSYNIPEYLCYSSKDLKNWTYHGVSFAVNKTTVPWASGSDSAWAAQVLKHNGRYYLYYCTWANSTYDGYQCIGVAESDKPEGPYTNVSTVPLINGKTHTTLNSSKWNDIDPTGWIETDDSGREHIYLNWGNSVNYTCELNDDMISVKDQNGDGQITQDDIVTTNIKGIEGKYTEAPSLYRRMGADGKYTGKYYLFFAKDWREQWAYATTDDIMSGEWDYGNLMMSANATANTSHGSVFDFNGRTYFLYHNGSLPWGSGYRRVANIQEVRFNADGSVDTMEELSTGINGTMSKITASNGKYVGHNPFTNPLDDAGYPITKEICSFDDGSTNDTSWEIVKGKYEGENESYVSIQSVNKPGLYIKADGNSAVLTQDADGNQAMAMTFKTVKAIDGTDGVSFESVAAEGKFLCMENGILTLSYPADLAACSFKVIGEPRIENENMADGSVSFTIKNAAEYGAVKAYIAEYANDGALAKIKIGDITITENSQDATISYEPANARNKVYILIWKGSMPVVKKTLIN